MVIIIILLGCCIGSFINVAFSRFSPLLTCYQYLSLITFKRSVCPYCQTKLTVWQLIPVFSWLILKRKCHFCQGKICCRYVFVELLIAILFLVIYLDKGVNQSSIILMILACYFLLLSLIDFNYYLLPDFFTQPLMWIGLICAYFELSTIELKSALTSILFGYLLLKIPAVIFYLVTKKDGLGQGDIKLLAAIGAWLPYERLPLLLVLASLFGIFYYLLLRYALKQQSLTLIPFGPFLLVSGYLIYYFV